MGFGGHSVNTIISDIEKRALVLRIPSFYFDHVKTIYVALNKHKIPDKNYDKWVLSLTKH